MMELPEGWEVVPLGMVTAAQSGVGFPHEYQGDSSGDLPFYKVGDISKAVLRGDRVLQHPAHYVTFSVAKRLRGEPIKPGSTVFAKIGEAIALNRRAQVTAPCLVDNNVMAVKAILNEMDSFIYHFLRQVDFSTLSRSTTVPSLRKGDVETFPLPLPPLAEQKRIADKLDSLLAKVDRCRERLDRIPGILKRFRQAVLAAATSGRLTEDWRGGDHSPTVDLRSVAFDFSYGSAAKSSRSGSVPVLRMGNIQSGRLDWSDLVFTSESDEIEKYALTDGDVLFNRTNSPELVGKTAVYKGERPAIFAGYLIRVRCSNRLLPEYLNYCLNSPAGRDYCWNVKSDGVSQSNINAQKLAAFTFELPSLEHQHEIVRRVELLFSYADQLDLRYQAARNAVDNLTPSLLAKAFRGELVPQDPNDEPASVLLERIKNQKNGSLDTRPRRRSRGADAKAAPAEKDEAMLDRNSVAPSHLTQLLKEHGTMTPEALWRVSQLEIDAFYEQLKDEELKGLLRELRKTADDASIMLEAIS